MRKDTQTADFALRALVALLLSASHVSTNIIVHTDSTTFETPSPANVSRTIRQAIREFRQGRGHILFKAHLEASQPASSRRGLTSEQG
jgi:hypothetical protein